MLTALARSAGDDASGTADTIKQYCNLDRIIRHVLTSYVQGLPEELGTKIETSYREFLLRSLQGRLRALGAGSWTILGSRGKSDDLTLVFTRLRDDQGREHDVTWYMDPSLKIVDVAYDGVLATELQKRELNQLLDRLAGDVASLPEALDRLAR